MGNVEWPSNNDKMEAIGYLAIPGVVKLIEATVPKGKKEEFRKEYDTLYSDEFPYEAEKFGRQFRVYLNDTDGCPNFLKSLLDKRYGERINNTAFVDELVKEYGFIFTRAPQDSNRIIKTAFDKCKTDEERTSLKKGYNVYKEFVDQIEEYVNKEKNLCVPNALAYKKKNISRKTENKNERKNVFEKVKSAYTPNQVMKLGWSGEEYITYLLKIKDKTILDELSIPLGTNFDVEWFNEGVQDAESELVNTSGISGVPYIENVKKWDDKSVGKGCDIVVTLDSGEELYIEVKTSKREYQYFNMTSIEMQEMECKKDKYFLVKINNFERLLKEKSPDIIVIKNPYKELFHPKHMKEATFIMGGESV